MSNLDRRYLQGENVVLVRDEHGGIEKILKNLKECFLQETADVCGERNSWYEIQLRILGGFKKDVQSTLYIMVRVSCSGRYIQVS